jgi:hypothetical protein
MEPEQGDAEAAPSVKIDRPTLKLLRTAAPEMYDALALMDAYLYATAKDSNERQIVRRALCLAQGLPW